MYYVIGAFKLCSACVCVVSVVCVCCVCVRAHVCVRLCACSEAHLVHGHSGYAGLRDR